ncbi:glycerate kinase [Paenibacillus glycanilyticus]|uniref:Glycerate kinase n=1 Tax=Paenibacillus glycanilyticus TaxID=126569 RepID=A0ABQ6GAR9_9BACL|nr:glycerate kinase [Paenibacillus glycanilyticus]GLX66681.1 glycerate kinase [Paenibacillus glycanilyticus]
MKIIISPDSFKGSMTTMDAADQIEAGIRAVYPQAETWKIPMADGGEGTVDTLLALVGGEKIKHHVHDPCGRPITASYCWSEKSKTAIIETAAASGLTLVPESERVPERLTTYGTGQLIKHALDQGAAKIILGLGGSATVDGGAGCLQALGVKFFDGDNKELQGSGQMLATVERIEFADIDPRLHQVDFVIASDVKNPLLGDQGAVYVFGPQKGLQPSNLDEYENKMRSFADQVKQSTGRDERHQAGAGAAGGLGFGLMSFLPKLQVMSGFELIANLSHLEELMKQADLIITGEGKFDSQSYQGKVPVGISRMAMPYQVPVVVFTGKIEGNASNAQMEGIRMVIPIVDQAMTLDQAMVQGKPLLFRSVKRFFETIRLTKESFVG